MSKFTVKPGSKVTIGIRGDAEKPAEKTGSRYIGVETEGDDYVFRKQDTIMRFYEIDPGAAVYTLSGADMDPHPALRPTLAKYQEIDAAVLAALQSGSVQPLTAPGEAFPVEIFSRKHTSPVLSYSLGLSQTRMFRQSAPYGEFRYVPSDQKDSERGSNAIRFRGNLQGKGSFFVGDNLLWRFFDTSFDPAFPHTDNGWKITDEPSFTAPRVDVGINGGTVKVYLKKTPKVATLPFEVWFYVPYSFWNDDSFRSQPFVDIADRDWRMGFQVDPRLQFEGYNPFDTPLHRSYYAYWNQRVAASGLVDEQVSATKAQFNTIADEYLQQQIDDNCLVGCFGYVWPPATYNPPGFWTPEEQAQVERYYADIPHGVFLYNCGFHGFNAVWDYEGELVGGFEYRGRLYYVWRRSPGALSTFFPQTLLHSLSIGSQAWEVEPGFIFDTETIGHVNPTLFDLHRVQDTTRNDFFVFPDGLPITGPIDFFFRPKFWVDFDAKPRRYQT